MAKLSLFAASLFWRLSVSRECRGVSLGRYEEELRTYLAVDAAPFPAHARLAVTLLDHAKVTFGRVDRSFVIYDSHAERTYDVHRFAILGVDMRLFVGGAVPRSLDELCFPRTRRVLVQSADDFARQLAPVLANSPIKGKLARS